MGRSLATRRWLGSRSIVRWAAAVVGMAVGLAGTSDLAAESTLSDRAGSLVNPAEELLAPLPEPVLDVSPLAEVAVDDQVTPAGYYGPSLGNGQTSVRNGRPINLISGPYIRAGVSLGLGSSLFDSQSAGWTVSGGFRNALPPMYDERMFLDFGGSYMSAYGEEAQVLSGNRTVRNTLTTIETPQFVPNAFSVHLREIKRAGIHAGFGWYWGAPLDAPGNRSQLRFAPRLGGRISHFRGRFFNEVIDDGPALGANEVITKIVPVVYGRTDTSGGLYAGAEAILLNRQHDWGTTSWTLDGEFANDWVRFDSYDSGSLGTASITLGWMFSR